METKWTEKHRLHLYKRLVQKFGSYTDQNYSPSDKEFLARMKRELNVMGLKTTTGGIAYQISWATTKQKKVKPEYTKMWILNVGAALEHGFISTANIPDGVRLKKR